MGLGIPGTSFLMNGASNHNRFPLRQAMSNYRARLPEAVESEVLFENKDRRTETYLIR